MIFMTTQILTLPQDVLGSVFSRLFFADVTLCKMVCKLFYQMINERQPSLPYYVPHARGENFLDHLRQNCPDFEKRIETILANFLHRVSTKNSGRLLISFSQNKDQYFSVKFTRNHVKNMAFDIDMSYEITSIKPQPVNLLQLYSASEHRVTNKAGTLHVHSNLPTNMDEKKIQQFLKPLLQKPLQEKKLVNHLQMAYFLFKLLLLITLILPSYAKP
jgi:F-box associated protein